METFGDQLRGERERRDVDLDEIARSTKIRVRYLRALEDGQHERLPGIVFAKGYVRAYAETIGADADRLVRAYVDEQRSLGRLQTEECQENVLEALAAAVGNERRPQGRGKWVAIVAVGLIGAAALWFGARPLIESRPAAVNSPQTVAIEANPALPVVPSTLPSTEPGRQTVAAPAPALVEDHAETGMRSELETQPPPSDGETETVEPQPSVTPVEAQPEPIVPPAKSVPSESTGALPEPASEMTIADYGVGTGVEQRELVGQSTSFDVGTQVVFWTRVMRGEPGRELRHVWLYEGNTIGGIKLPIGGTHWRTYSQRTLRAAGNWRVEAHDESGQLLASVDFVVR